MDYIPEYIKYSFIGFISGALIVADAFANDKIEHPKNDDGETHRLKTSLVYITSIGFSVASSVLAGMTASTYFGSSDNMTYVVTGLAGIAGKDGVQLMLRHFKVFARRAK